MFNEIRIKSTNPWKLQIISSFFLYTTYKIFHLWHTLISWCPMLRYFFTPFSLHKKHSIISTKTNSHHQPNVRSIYIKLSQQRVLRSKGKKSVHAHICETFAKDLNKFECVSISKLSTQVCIYTDICWKMYHRKMRLKIKRRPDSSLTSILYQQFLTCSMLRYICSNK